MSSTFQDAAATSEITPIHRTIRRPSTFLSLAPVHSDTYPKNPPASPTGPRPRTASVSSLSSSSSSPLIITEPKVATVSRRHSSTSSVGSVRFLKLGPVHYGGDGGDDYAIEE